MLIIGITACGSTIYGPTAEAWLDSVAQKSPYDLSGRWKGPEGIGAHYWGYDNDSFCTMVLIQKGTKITGTYGEYELIGAVDRDNVFLVALSRDVVYFTWHFTYSAKAKSLSGKMCDGYCPKVKPYCYNLTLKNVT